MPQTVLIDQLSIKINGTALTEEERSKVRTLTIDSSLHIPDMFIIRLGEIEQALLDSDKFKVGALVDIGLSEDSNNNALSSIFTGEITALEPIFEDNVISLDVRGYDKAHRLHRGTKTKAWINVKDSDIAQQIASSVGLTPEVDSTTEVYKHVFQYAQTDFEFLTERAERIGYIVYTENGKLKFIKPTKPAGADKTLEWNKELISFRPRLTLSEQVDTVTVKGWDPQKKEAITGQASSSDVNPATGNGGWGGATAKQAISAATNVTVRKWVQTQADATTIAQGLLNNANGGFIEAEGEAEGVPTLHAGMVVEIKGVGTKFSGKYKVTTVRHEYRTGTYHTSFTVEGSRPDLLSYLVEAPDARDLPWGGVVTAIVTNNNFTEADYGYVKLKYPWLDDAQESYWARIALPGGGAERGIYFMPEINDEVLVAFEHGDFNRPYILGGLYNGKDAPAAAIGEVIESGAVKTRIIKTRTGHTVTFVDDSSGNGTIEIKDAEGNTRLLFDGTNQKITMESKGEIEIHATGNLTLKSDANIDINATSNVTIKGVQISAQGSAQAELKSPQTTVEGSGQVTVKGAMAEVNGSGTTIVKGGVVMIN